MDLLEKVAAPLGRLTEIYMLRLNAITLLSSYIGRDSGQRVLEGQVHRGDGEEISAVILFVDLKDFTSMSNRIPGRDLVELLHEAIDILAPQVAQAGGEILKFMGAAFWPSFHIVMKRKSATSGRPPCAPCGKRKP
ncbi:hypothetical protein K1W69_19075 [Hoeflea sp. WL0058]|uniref:Guanylate cyclase domain-containing protein n=1 Tax=Flavimaribacter sediminis TaxID=2865987 RepID=A0AAE3D156_9HYPH|nr:adenylate/guanylate cyclase domain-containing protein [Flavimaribacter sediminis]MBW8639305.1 hypothetical protein [Flavimaribacter sediminis]